MAFTKALYYPRIEVPNEGWLKTAMLYWDEIKTIVPASMPEPYTAATSRALFDAGALSPLHVHPRLDSVEKLAGKVLDYLGSPEADGVLVEGGMRQSDLIHPEKLPELREVFMHPDKFPDVVMHQLERLIHGREGDWIRVNRPFARFYMTMLATELAESNGIAMLTDMPASDRLAVSVRLDGKLGIPYLRIGDPYWHRYGRHWYHEHRMPGTLAPALLADLTLQRVAISPDTSVDEILRFREGHKGELGRFRTKMADLTKSIQGDIPLAALQQSVSDIYTNEVKPAVDELKDCLSASRIKWALESFLKTSMLSIPSGSALAGLGLSIPHAVLAGAGISLVVSAVLFNLQKEEEMRKNPFSYLLAAESHFGA